MNKPVYTNNFQIFIANGDNNTGGETTIMFNHVWRFGKTVHPVNPQTNEVDNDSYVPGNGVVIINTDNVCSIVMNRDSLYQLRDSLNSVITQMEVDEKMKRLSEDK